MHLSDPHLNVLEHIIENGPITVSDGIEYYSARPNFYRAMETLEEHGVITRARAPEQSQYEYVFDLTRKGRIIIEE